MLSHSIQYQKNVNDFNNSFRYVKCQPYYKMLKVVEAVKSFFSLSLELQAYFYL